MNHTPLKEQQKKHLQGVFTTLSTVQSLNDPNNSAWGLTPEIELELLTDIEQRGGLGQVNLKRLCTEKSCTYGEKNSTLLERSRTKLIVGREKVLQSLIKSKETLDTFHSNHRTSTSTISSNYHLRQVGHPRVKRGINQTGSKQHLPFLVLLILL